MSALGHKRTYAAQNGMSALPPIATTKADIGNRSCLLYPRERTWPFKLRLCHHSYWVVTMGTIFLVAYILVGIAQIWAGLEGMQLYFGIGGFLAIIFLSVAYAVPLVGTVGVALLAYYGARYGW